MESILAPQVEFLLMLQNLREASGGIFDNFFMFITSCGEITIPVILIAGIYWCINSKYGMYILWNWCFGTILCQLLKVWACIYRPWILDARIKPIPEALKMAGGYSFPSGHSQTAVSTWGAMAVCFKNKFFRIFVVIMILLIAFSRMYIGVHTPQDVLVSLFAATILLFVTKKLFDWSEKGKNRDMVIYIGVILSALALLAFEHFKTFPTDYVNGQLLVDPIKMKLYTFPKLGLYLGVFTGWILTKRFLNFDGSVGTPKEKILRFVIGAVILAVISTQTTSLLSGIIAPKYAMFFASLTSSLFVTFIYPAILIGIEKLKKN